MDTVQGPNRTPEDRLTHLVEVHQLALLRLCFAYLHDQTLAEDAVQETFLKAYKALPRFRGESSEKTWLMRIAVNTCKDISRSAWLRHTDRRRPPEDMPLASPPPNDEAEALARAIARLPRKYKAVILLYYYQDMGQEEVAQALKVTASTVSRRLARARDMLRDALEGGIDT